MRVKENIALEFDDFSADYTQDMINCVPHYLKLMNSVVEALPESFEPEHIVDMGAGNGNLTALLKSVLPQVKYTLVDASPEMLRICKERFGTERTTYFQGYFDEYSTEANSIDLITASFSFHHIDSEQKKNMFQRAYHLLKPGGILASCDLMIHKSHPDHPQLVADWGEFVNSHYPDEEKWLWIMEHYDTFDKPDLFDDQMAWLQDAGFSEVNIPWREGYWCSLQAIK